MRPNIIHDFKHLPGWLDMQQEQEQPASSKSGHGFDSDDNPDSVS